MKFMVIAGESSGDILAAELIQELRQSLRDTRAPEDASPVFFGAGGARMAAAGVRLHVDLTQHAVVGLIEVLKRYRTFRRLFNQLLQRAISEQPDVLILVDFSGFNRRFAHAVRRAAANLPQWRPRIVQYVSPQVWASREGRAQQLARDLDLLLAIFPFEKDWYARRTPSLPVAFVGHPILDRYSAHPPPRPPAADAPPLLVLLPGSRSGELNRHLPVMLPAVDQIRTRHPVSVRMILPSDALLGLARSHIGSLPGIDLQVGTLAESLSQATLAIASTGTVTMECAYFRVPTVALYKTSWSTFQIGKRIVKVPYLAMPNLLADRPVFPELIQHEATAGNIAREALQLLDHPKRREAIRAELTAIISALGGPGASRRAAAEITRLAARQSG